MSASYLPSKGSPDIRMELTTTTVDRILERIYAVVVDDDRQRQPRIACQLAMAVDVVLTVENQRSPSKSSKTAVNESPNKSSKMAADKSSKRNSSMSAAAQVSSTAMTKTLKSRTLALVTNDNRECALVLLLMRHRGRRRGEGSDQVPGDDHADNNGKHERNRIADNVSDDTIVIDQCLPVMDDFQCVVVQPSSDVVTAKVSTDTTLRFTSRHFDMDVTVRVSSDGNVQSLLGALKHWQRLAAAGNEGEPNIPLDTHGWCRALMNARRNERRRDVDNSNDGLPAISSLSLDQNNDAIDGIAASETSTTASRSSLLSPPSNPFLPRPNSGSFEASSTDTAATLHHLTNLSDAAALHAIKERWVATQLKAREQEFMEWREVLVFAGTWNVNGKLVVGGELAAWLGCAVGGKMGRAEGDDVNGSDVPADILVLGFQEVDLSAEAFLLNDSPREEYWAAAIEAGIARARSPATYRKLVSKQLVGMLLFVYVRSEMAPHVHGVATDSAGCGIMGMMGNKGGVAVRFRLHDSWLCFINSHLAADTKEVVRRNLDYAEICRRLRFEPSAGKVYNLWQCDTLVWLGDLNYRVTLHEAEAKSFLANNDLSSLLVHDQLAHERKARRAFADFDEAPIAFPPSYKYDPGTDIFDTSEKRRTPSWCDRVLWRKGDFVQPHHYRTHMDLKRSDHKPVSLRFTARIKHVNRPRQAAIHQLILRDLDKFENECMPDATVSENALAFGDVHWGRPVSRTVVVENTGQVVVQMRFVPKLDEKHVAKPWLWINPPLAMLLPGDRVTITFTVLVDRTSAAALNIGTDRIEDILILHLENGKDFFISISGSFQPTCFSMPLALLVRMPEPVRLSRDIIERWSTVEARKEMEAVLSVPKEVWRLVDHLFQHGLKTPDLFLCSGDATLMESIRECLDTGRPFSTNAELMEQSRAATALAAAKDPDEAVVVADPVHAIAQYMHAISETLIRLLDALPEPVVPSTGPHYQRCIDAHQSFPLAEQAVANLPAVHRNVFVYIVSFLREVLRHIPREPSTYQDRDPATSEAPPIPAVNAAHEKLAAVFASVLIRTPGSVPEKYVEIIARKKKAFVLHFLREGATRSGSGSSGW